MQRFQITGALYERKKRRCELSTPRHHAEMTRIPLPGKRIRTRVIVRALFSPTTWSNQGYDRRSDHYSKSDENTYCECEYAEHGASGRLCFFCFSLREKSRIDRNKRPRERSLTKKILQKVWNLERSVESIRRIRAPPKIVVHRPLAYESNESTRKDTGSDEKGVLRA
jgi:hypothetical protein